MCSIEGEAATNTSCGKDGFLSQLRNIAAGEEGGPLAGDCQLGKNGTVSEFDQKLEAFCATAGEAFCATAGTPFFANPEDNNTGLSMEAMCSVCGMRFMSIQQDLMISLEGINQIL